MLPLAMSTILCQFSRGSRDLVNLGSVLDQLLRWEYWAFTEPQLVEVERIMEHLPQQARFVAARVAAARAYHASHIPDGNTRHGDPIGRV